MAQNITIIQLFHWYTPNDGAFWKTSKEQAADLFLKGITHVYLPPAYKSGRGADEPGYAVYDLYDLGEFDQQGTVRTKYGTKDEYLACIKSFQENNISVIADVVLNHRQGGDEKEKFMALPVNPDNRTEIIGEAEEVESFTKFNFPNRKGKYSKFKFNHTHFTGADAVIDGVHKIFLIENIYGNTWENMADDELGNFDYLMGADVEYRNEEVKKEIIEWGKWYVTTTGVDGFRMDALKHISPLFIKDWINAMKAHFKKDFFIIGEYWKIDTGSFQNYLTQVEDATQLMDVKLHYNFNEASQQKNEYDLRTILEGSLVQERPEMSITFVENHDTQPLQSLESPVESWFKPLAYAIILLRKDGIPMVFNPCMYGACYAQDIDGKNIDVDLPKVPELQPLLHVRQNFAYGEQVDYMDHTNCIGWVRQGIEEKENSGCAVLISNGEDGFKEMDMGKHNAGKVFADMITNMENEVTINDEGIGHFTVKGMYVSVWVLRV